SRALRVAPSPPSSYPPATMRIPLTATLQLLPRKRNRNELAPVPRPRAAGVAGGGEEDGPVFRRRWGLALRGRPAPAPTVPLGPSGWPDLGSRRARGTPPAASVRPRMPVTEATSSYPPYTSPLRAGRVLRPLLLFSPF